jgi:hypothetical protein
MLKSPCLYKNIENTKMTVKELIIEMLTKANGDEPVCIMGGTLDEFGNPEFMEIDYVHLSESECDYMDSDCNDKKGKIFVIQE